MNIVIPMAGRGTRVNLDRPKPLGKIFDKSLIEWAVSTLNLEGQYIFITRLYDHPGWNYELQELLMKIKPGCKIISVNYTTEGPASSALLAKELINNDQPLIITNCDQILEWNAEAFQQHVTSTNCDGCVVTYPTDKPSNSYVAVDETGQIINIAEKKVISNNSLNGIHYWKQGKDFVWAAEKMIQDDIRTNGEFYISLTYYPLMLANKKLNIFQISPDEHWAVGIQSDIERFKEYYAGKKNN